MDIVLLCAGTSSRMNGEDKLLLDADGMSLSCRSAMSAIEFIKTQKEKSRLIIVTGYRSKEVLASVSESLTYAAKNSVEVLTVFNQYYEKGQTSSTKKGLELVEDNNFFIALGDMPLLKPSHYRVIAENLKGYDAVRPFNNSKPGHPVLFSNRVKERILALEDTQSIKTIMASIKTKNLILEDEAFFTDCDTKQDYCSLLARLCDNNKPLVL